MVGHFVETIQLSELVQVFGTIYQNEGLDR